MDRIPRAFDVLAHHQKLLLYARGELFEPRCERLFIVLECIQHPAKMCFSHSPRLICKSGGSDHYLRARHKGYFLTCVTGNNNLGSTLCVTKARRLRFVKTTPL